MIDLDAHKQRLELVRSTMQAKIADGHDVERSKAELAIVEAELAQIQSQSRGKRREA